jgi:O-antigen biosynthesis protein WbqV
VKVLGDFAELDAIVTRFRKKGIIISELIDTEAEPDRQHLAEVVETSARLGIKASRIPDFRETSLLTSQSILRPKAIDLGDLLGRPEITADLEGVARLVSGKVVLVTGAGGSIGSELCRQIAEYRPDQLILTDSSEFHLYKLDMEIRENYPKLNVVTALVNVRDRGRVASVFAHFHPKLVFHAAALKHVPMVESNAIEGIKTNLLGTRNVADAAVRHGVENFVMISTDKAVNPTNVMGATKRAAEAYCQALDVTSQTTLFTTVRFGNVLGSNGSVVPRFQKQILAGGPVTVTHPDIVRFFMSIPEAVCLVLNASAAHVGSKRGDIMVLDMGKPVKIVDLAERMIQLAGLKPHADIEIIFTGLRPGEKLYEELFDPSEVSKKDPEVPYFVASPRVIDKDVLHKTLAVLEGAIANEDQVRCVELLNHIVPEYTPEGSGFPKGVHEHGAAIVAKPEARSDRHGV